MTLKLESVPFPSHGSSKKGRKETTHSRCVDCFPVNSLLYAAVHYRLATVTLSFVQIRIFIYLTNTTLCCFHFHYATKNVHPAHTLEKTAIMFYVAPTRLAWNGDEPSFSISEQHVTNCILILTFKWFYSQLWKPGSRIPQLISLSTPPNIPTSSGNKRRSAGVKYLTAVWAQSGRDFRTNICTSKDYITRRQLVCYGQRQYWAKYGRNGLYLDYP
jgi:hypothetical protein